MQATRGTPLTPGSPPAHPSRTRVGLLLTVAISAYLADQISKAAVVAWFGGGRTNHLPIDVFEGALTLTLYRNPGAAFSFGEGYTVVFTLVAVAVVVVIARIARRLRSPWWAVAFGGLLGGAMGNLTDRLFRMPGFPKGQVVDWIQVPHFAVFNLADSAITCASVLMVALSLRNVPLDGSGLQPAPGARLSTPVSDHDHEQATMDPVNPDPDTITTLDAALGAPAPAAGAPAAGAPVEGPTADESGAR